MHYLHLQILFIYILNCIIITSELKFRLFILILNCICETTVMYASDEGHLNDTIIQMIGACANFKKIYYSAMYKKKSPLLTFVISIYPSISR